MMPPHLVLRLTVRRHPIQLHDEAAPHELTVTMPGGRPVREHQQRAIHGRDLDRKVVQVISGPQQAQAAILPGPVRRLWIEVS